MWYGILKTKDVFLKEVNLNLNTVIGKDMLKGYIVQNVDVYKQGKKITTIKKIVISFSKQKIGCGKKYSALIGYNTYVENLRGVTLC